MRVLTLHKEDFKAACQQLKATVARRGFHYDLLVGIATGGAIVAREFDFEPMCVVEQQRPGSRGKQKWGKMLRYLPAFVCEWLRKVEARMLMKRDARRRLEPLPSVALSPETQEMLAAEPERVLIVDDAVDSGVTLAAVKREIEKALPKAEVRTAVITVTRPAPLVEPDYALYRDETLVRFPWSADMM